MATAHPAGRGSPSTATRLEGGKPEINRELQVRQWSNNTIRRVQRPWLVRAGLKEKTTFLLVTPRVLEEVRQHFDCSTLEGAELEDQGGEVRHNLCNARQLEA